jgi:short-subunit dehydrogenase
MAINEEKKHPNHILSRTLDNIWIRTRKFLQKDPDPEIAEEQRQLIIHELLALQKLKSYHHGISNNNPQHSSSERGYALVTGASRGIGRALAVELARWGIPLILVARSGDKLSTLAQEIESCYGVRCHALPADLSDPTAAFMVYNTTKSAGLHVDILVNNAGICTRGELVESSTTDISRLLQLNIASVTTLSQLYGKDMKKQRKGRILFVSSIAAGAPSTPEVAAYAASKAYEKSLSMALSMELAKYGVGVTCLMPGAVKGTSFASSSRIDDALCWKVPGYAMSAPKVASVGIRALLNGAVEVAPGWHNFSFLKFIVPTLPPRVSSTIASMAFRPIFAEPKSNHDSHDENYGTEDILSSPYSAPQTESMMEPVLLDNNEDKPIS